MKQVEKWKIFLFLRFKFDKGTPSFLSLSQDIKNSHLLIVFFFGVLNIVEYKIGYILMFEV